MYRDVPLVGSWPWPYRFSSWPEVCLRTTDVVAISKSDILFFPPLFSRSYSPLHCTALPSLYFSLHLHFITSRFFLPPYLVHESIRFHMRWLWANLLKRLMLEVSGEYFKLSCFFFIISDSYLFYVSLFQIIIRRRIASILKFSIIIIRVRKILSLVLLNF